MAFSWFSFVIALILLWIYKRWLERHSIGLTKYFPSNKIEYILGFGPLYSSKDVIKRLRKIAEKYGSTSMIYMGPISFLHTCDPHVVKDVLTSKFCLNKARALYDGFEYAAGKGLVTSQGNEWKHERSIYNNAFRAPFIPKTLPMINRRITLLQDVLDKIVESKQPIKTLQYFREFTMGVSFESVIGRNMDTTQYTFKKMASGMTLSLVYMSDLALNFMLTNPLLRFIAGRTIHKEGRQTLLNITAAIGETLEAYPSQDGSDPSYEHTTKSSIHYVHEAIKQNQFPKELAPQSLFHVVLGSFETTALTICNTMFLLAMHPDVQEKAYKEVCEAFPDDDDGEFDIDHNQIPQLIYLDKVMKETMRVFPPIPQVGRQVVGGDLTLSNGVVIKEGQRIVIDIFNMHRNKAVWGPDADKFNPDHFLPENIESKPPYAFIPFTKGIRYCIGMQSANMSMRATVARLLKRYKFSTQFKYEDLKYESRISLYFPVEPELEIVRRKTMRNA
ncbi:putative cytochrome P450 313a4 isoform X2 [Haematobia irritans]|uniref:putative cytochrome P450 313a4 isoform X2 n=1 Tax=Haematobia irritans TaxID=7368 RepID=UPI003F4FB0E2